MGGHITPPHTIVLSWKTRPPIKLSNKNVTHKYIALVIVGF